MHGREKKSRKEAHLLHAVQVDPFSMAFDKPIPTSQVLELFTVDVHPVSSGSHCPGIDRLLLVQEAHSLFSTCTDDCKVHVFANQICISVCGCV